MKNIALALVAMIGFSGAALAQGDAAAGETKSATCVACHGADGNSPTDMYPKLAGQHPKYLEKQLKEFKLAMETGGEKGRNNAIMGGMVAGLTEQDMADLAAYYGGKSMSPATTPEEVVEAGQKLYMGGDAARGIPACTACHGPRGEGTELSGFPKISSQHPAYIKSQLELFRSGERNNDMNGMMGDIAKKLTDEDIAILSKYISGLH
ncbi:c-type cytochrome [Motilimonas cestriensis]|uniref:c-type cytochrome n=1 Tax=Motilimonas cestriensis TaxID=2742685 RepID=UPI003DA50753